MDIGALPGITLLHIALKTCKATNSNQQNISMTDSFDTPELSIIHEEPSKKEQLDELCDPLVEENLMLDKSLFADHWKNEPI